MQFHTRFLERRYSFEEGMIADGFYIKEGEFENIYRRMTKNW